MSRTRIVIIGATGHFGGRIGRRILGEPNTELVITSRSLGKVESLSAKLAQMNADAMVSAAALDQTSSSFAEDLAALRPDIVIHTAGPYQGQGYDVARSCLACGSHYIDLADGREFVEGFDALHEDACRKGVLLVSGASTLPGLSSAVVDHVRGEFESIHSIETSIAPAHQTPRGAGTVAAVLSYCGAPFQVFENGEWITRYGWQDLKMQRYPEFGRRLSGACDVPDLGLFPEYVNGVQTVTFHAALEATWEQITLWKMAWATRLGIVRNWERLVPTFQSVSDRLIKLGSTTGGMQIRIAGEGDDKLPKTLMWNLVAHQNHGPEIPCVPALILARKLAAGRFSTTGAYPCLGMISLPEFDEEISDLDIHWRMDEVNE
ncbi:MAG: saccharopine dehydrogenase [Woeseiaceae bacterium]|nr:saccharopine dehydrogenase [Woeseiaceae bacterium]